jgi:hypothetical protein
MHIDLAVIVQFLTFLTLLGGLFVAIRKFGLSREYRAFVHMSVTSRTIRSDDRNALVAITVRIENKGDGRLNARRTRRADGYLYNDGDDQCVHAGTLKVRAVPQEQRPLLFDWYSLLPLRMTTRLTPADKPIEAENDLEQINYLDEFQDPTTDYRESDFWLEPREAYDFAVPVWLPPGIYAAKAFFLGSLSKQREDEYWSCQAYFSVPAQKDSSQSNSAQQ